MNECATRMLRAALLMLCASPQTAARESCCEWCWTKPRGGAAGGCAVVGAVDGARAADLFGEVVDDSLGWRRDAALAFDSLVVDKKIRRMFTGDKDKVSPVPCGIDPIKCSKVLKVTQGNFSTHVKMWW